MAIAEKQKIAKYTGERRKSKLDIKRHFTYPNLSPYELEISTPFQKKVRHIVRDIANKGIYLEYIEELEACYFEDELAYMMIQKMIDVDIKNINLKKFIEFNKRFNIDSFKHGANIISIVMSIANDSV